MSKKILTEKEKKDRKIRLKSLRLRLGSGIKGEDYKKVYREYMCLLGLEGD